MFFYLLRGPNHARGVRRSEVGLYTATPRPRKCRLEIDTTADSCLNQARPRCCRVLAGRKDLNISALNHKHGVTSAHCLDKFRPQGTCSNTPPTHTIV